MTGPKPHRIARINSALRDAVADVLREVNDEAVGLVSVVEVRTAPDLRNATVFLSIFADDRAAAHAAVDRAWGFIARQAVRRVPLRRTPRLCWKEDETIARADRIERLLKGREAT